MLNFKKVNVKAVEKLEEVLSDKVRFISFESQTIPKMRKTNNPYFDRVVKLTRAVVQVGRDYENAVNNQLKKEGKEANFKASPPSGRHHISKLLTAKNDDEKQLYVNIFYFNNDKARIKVKYIDTITGKEIDKALLAPFMPKANEAEQGGVDKKIIIRPYKLESINWLACAAFSAGKRLQIF